MNVLIAGGSGLIGNRLGAVLNGRGHSTALLTRGQQKNDRSYLWNPSEGKIDPAALKWANAVINLAGAGVADAPWTPSRKAEIEKSRMDSTQGLVKAIASVGGIQTLISASAIGFYGSRRGDELLKETSDPGNDFLSQVCQSWEQAALPSKNFTRLSVVRIGIVLSAQGGALEKIIGPARWGLLSALGSGQQWMSWIHIDDLCEIFIFLLENPNLQGVFNATAPNPETNASFTRKLGKVLGKNIWLPPVPEFAMKLLMGEMSEIVLGGQRVAPQALLDAGFQFKFLHLESALQDLLLKKN